MTAEHLEHLPNTIAMALLIVALLFLQRRQPRLMIGSWLLALTLILSSQISWYFTDSLNSSYVYLHTYRLCTDLGAGIIFLLFTGQKLSSTPQRVLRLLWNGVPFIALEAVYGFDVQHPAPYLACAAAGIAISVLLALPLRKLPFSREWDIPAVQIAVWIVLAEFALHGQYRTAAYWGLGCVYAAAAFNLWLRLRRGTAGQAVLVGSVAILSATFFMHPWMIDHTRYFPMAEEIWSLQKFFITTGMLLALLEEESRENERLAMKDELTGVANRRFMEKRLIEAVEHGPVGVVMLDLDDFKDVNDSLGHSTGDELLREIASRLEQIVHAKDTLARLGGDEFLIISTSDIKELAARVRFALQEPIPIRSGLAVPIQASVGTASYPQDTEGFHGTDAVKHLLHVADGRMYASKKYSSNFQTTAEKQGRLKDRRSAMRP